MATQWPNVEERLRAVLDAFQECAGFTPRDRLRTEWIAGARNYVSNVGERADLIAPSVKYMQEHDMLIKSPGSLVTVALKMKGKTVVVSDVCPECGAAFGTHDRDCTVPFGE